MAQQLKARVGRNAKNDPEDVKLVVELLNQHICLGKLNHLSPLSSQAKGDSPAVVRAIDDFQKYIVGYKNPDGRVDPGGKTIAKLQEPPVAPAAVTPFVRRLVRIANDELNAWTRARGKYYGESSSQMIGRLKSYYLAAGKSASEANRLAAAAADDKTPWSAVFISYLFTQAGASDFPVHTAHSWYVTRLKANAHRDRKTFPLQAYPINDFGPAVGDLICVWRDANPKKKGAQRPHIHGKKVTWDAIESGSWVHFSSHCDLIVRIVGRVAYAIGGNVGNRVKETRYNINGSNRISHSRGIVLIKNYK